jgi:hypothetical protein
MADMYDWDCCFGIYKPLKGKRFSTIKKNAKDLINDVVFLAALEGDYENDMAKIFMKYCTEQIYPLGGDKSVALGICSYVYSQLNEQDVVLAEIYDLFNQVSKYLEGSKEYKDLAYSMSSRLFDMSYYISLSGVRTKSSACGDSSYNDDDRRENWPLKLPKDLNMDDLLNIAWMLSNMVMINKFPKEETTVSFLGLMRTSSASREIMEKVKEFSESKNINKGK